MVQTTRKIHCLANREVKTANFSGAKKKRITYSSVAVEMALNEALHREQAKAAKDTNELEELREMFEGRRRFIENSTLPDGRVRFDREQRARPLVNLYHGRNPKVQNTSRHVAMPIILMNVGKPRVGDLKPYISR